MSATPPLIFRWAPPRAHTGAAAIFLLASLLLHGLCFYIFQVVYPPTVAVLPAPARVNIISSKNAETASLLRWVEAEDPALTTTTQRPPDSASFPLPAVQHVPWYSGYQPHLREVPLPTPDLTVPSSAALGPVRIPSIKTKANGADRNTTAHISALTADLGQPILPSFVFHGSRTDAPANARFCVGIDEEGVVRYCFISQSSGDPTLDEQAHAYLLLCRFKTMPLQAEADSIFWGEAIILWGNDVTPPSRTSPTPGAR